MTWLSPSKMGTYLQCAKRYKYRYVDKVPEPTSEILERGTMMHETVEQWYKDTSVLSEGSQEITFAPLPAMFDKFVAFEKKRYDALEDKSLFYPIKQEMKLADHDAKMRGIADAIYKDENGDYILIDYKSGKHNPARYSGYRQQLAFYKMVVDNLGVLDKPIKYWGIIFLDHGILFFEEAKPRSMKALVSAMDKTHKGIVEERYEPSVSPLCAYCGFKDKCDSWGGQ